MGFWPATSVIETGSTQTMLARDDAFPGVDVAEGWQPRCVGFELSAGARSMWERLLACAPRGPLLTIQPPSHAVRAAQIPGHALGACKEAINKSAIDALHAYRKQARVWAGVGVVGEVWWGGRRTSSCALPVFGGGVGPECAAARRWWS